MSLGVARDKVVQLVHHHQGPIGIVVVIVVVVVVADVVLQVVVAEQFQQFIFNGEYLKWEKGNKQ